VILVTQCSRDAFIARYPRQPRAKFVLIPNGCDLQEYALMPQRSSVPRGEGFTIAHAGLLQESGNWRRSPEGFFRALAGLCRQHPCLATHL